MHQEPPELPRLHTSCVLLCATCTHIKQENLEVKRSEGGTGSSTVRDVTLVTSTGGDKASR